MPGFAAAAAWIPTALALGMPLLVLAAVWLWIELGGRRGGDDDSGSDDGPGGGRRHPPDRPLPTGPVSWPEFERQFAAFVERGARQDVGTARVEPK